MYRGGGIGGCFKIKNLLFYRMSLDVRWPLMLSDSLILWNCNIFRNFLVYIEYTPLLVLVCLLSV
jgi:hypothetical protein